MHILTIFQGRIVRNDSCQYPTIDDLTNCIIPWVADAGTCEEDYTCGVYATGFYAFYQNTLYAITSKHAYNQGSEFGDDLKIWLNPNCRSYMPLHAINKPVGDEKVKMYTDFVIIEVDIESIKEKKQQNVHAISLDHLRFTEAMCDSAPELYVIGYPKCTSDVDFDNKVISVQPYQAKGKYLSKEGSPGVYLLRFNNLDAVDSVDGMSGSPVFIESDYNGRQVYEFGGVLTWAQNLSTNAKFIGANIIYQALEKIPRA